MSIYEQYGPLLRAASFAARAHHGQLRKDNATPYASHPFRVCLIARDVFGVDDPRVLIAALLHDVIEDTTTDFDDIADEFGSEIAEWVSLLSKDKRKVEQERETAYVEQLRNAPWQVQVCKLADVFDNIMDVPNLPASERKSAVDKKRKYVDAVKGSNAPELVKPLQIVEQLMREASNVLSRS